MARVTDRTYFHGFPDFVVFSLDCWFFLALCVDIDSHATNPSCFHIAFALIGAPISLVC